MANDVKVDFTADISQLKRAATEIKSEIKSIASTPIPTNAFAELDKNFANLERYALSVRGTLRTIERSTVGVAGLDGLGQAAKRSIQDVTVLYNRIQAIQVEMGQTRDPIALSRLAKEAREAGVALDTLNTKIQRVAAGRAAAEQRVRASALDPTKAFSRGQLGRQVVNAADPRLGMAAELGETLSNTGLVSGAGLAAGGAVAAAGFAAVKVSEKLREQSEKRLKAEEKLQGVYNEQAKAMASTAAVDDLRGKFLDPTKLTQAQYAIGQLIKQRQSQGFGYGEEGKQTLDQFLAPDRALRDANAQIGRSSNSVSELERVLAGLQNGSFQPNLTGQARMDLIKSVSFQLDDLRRAMTGFSEAETAQFKAEQKAFKARQEAKAAEIKAVQAQIKQFQAQTKSTADSLFVQKYSDNPFVKVFKDAEKAMESLKASTKGLNRNIQESLLNTQREINSLALFSANLDNKLAGIQLRDQAKVFRQGGTDDQLRDMGYARARADYDRFVRERDAEELSGLYRGSTPELLAQYRRSLSPVDALASFNAQRGAEERSGLYRGDTDELRRMYARAATQELSPETKFNKQIDAILSSNPQSEQEKALADRKLLAIGDQLDPSRMTAGQRSQFASAAEREAVRREQYETNALKLMEDQRGFLKAISESIGKDFGEAYLKGGVKGLNALITVKNDTETDVSVKAALRSPTPADTEEQYP